MSIERLPFERRPRNSIANNLDKINELVDWVNLDTHLYASASGERVTVDDTSSIKGLTVNGRSVQDGTPTPDAPVEVQTVKSPNFIKNSAASKTENGITFTVNDDGTVSLSGTATANTALIIALQGVNGIDWTNLIGQTVTLSGGVSSGIRLLFYADSSPAFGDSGNGITFTVNNIANTGTTSTTSRCYIYVNANTVCDGVVIKPQLEAGSTATPYVPYGSIGIVVGDTATLIDLQGNTLASLPDGTRDELHVDSTGRVWIEKRVGQILTPTDISNVINLIQITGGARWKINVDGLNSEEILDGSTNGYCSHTPFKRSISLGSIGSHVYTYGGQAFYVIEGDFTASTAVTWVNSHQMTIIYPLATPQTIDLGYITPPAIPSGSVVTVSASLTPEFTLEWWVDDGITALVNDLIAYVDYKTEG